MQYGHFAYLKEKPIIFHLIQNFRTISYKTPEVMLPLYMSIVPLLSNKTPLCKYYLQLEPFTNVALEC